MFPSQGHASPYHMIHHTRRKQEPQGNFTASEELRVKRDHSPKVTALSVLSGPSLAHKLHSQ